MACRFCSHFGRDLVIGDKRRRIANVKFFRFPLKVNNFKSHIAGQHLEDWKDYESKSSAQKLTYFDDARVGETFLSHFEREKTKLRVLLEKSVVD